MIMLTSLEVWAHPLALHALPAAHDAPSTNTEALQKRNTQSPLSGSVNSTAGFRTLQELYEGNMKFRQNVRLQATRLIDEAPSFMFLGCVDNRLSPSTIFNAPAGSIISHNNIANQYSSKDPSADAAIAHAIESMHVQHIIILGHYGCKGVETAITQSNTASRLVKSWVKPISDLYSRTRRTEIVKLRDSRLPQRGKPNGVTTAPAADDAGFRALVEENVKRGVNELRKHSILTKAYAWGAKADKNGALDVFVHGLVYDETTGEVHDLNVSFGPPGKKIPTIPFNAVAAAKNIQRDSDRPGITKGKTWDFGNSH
ncbi:carbonic anhydrase [Flammula alnicola]|nr:carbonic anhydrase [Flammula alnicola]